MRVPASVLLNLRRRSKRGAEGPAFFCHMRLPDPASAPCGPKIDCKAVQKGQTLPKLVTLVCSEPGCAWGAHNTTIPKSRLFRFRLPMADKALSSRFPH